MAFPIIPLFVTNELNATASLYGTTALVVSFVAVLFRIPSGGISDRFGRRPAMFFGAALGAGYPALLVVTQSIGVFFVAQVIFGLSLAIYTTILKAYIADIAPAERRGEALGINTAAFSLALILGPLSGEFLKNTFSFQAAFATATVTAILSFAILWFLPPDEPNTEPRESMLRGATAVLRFRGAWAALATAVAGATLFVSFFTFFPLYADALDLADDAPTAIRAVAISLGFSLFAMVNFVVMPYAGRFSDRHGRTLALLPGSVSLIGLWIFASRPNLWGAYVAVLITAFGFSWLRAMMDALMQDASPATLRGTGSAILFTGWDIVIGTLAQFLSLTINGSDFSVLYSIAMVSVIVFGGIAVGLSAPIRRLDHSVVGATEPFIQPVSHIGIAKSPSVPRFPSTNHTEDQSAERE